MTRTQIISRINKDIVYPSIKTIDPEDFGTKSYIYEIDILGMQIAVLLGVPKYTYTDQGVVYFPIYAVSREKVRSQIGVFELKSGQIINSFKDGELDVSMLDEPLLYDFIDLAYLGKLNSDPKYYTKIVPDAANTVVPIATATEPEIEDQEDQEDDPFRLKLREKQISKEKEQAKTELQMGIFESVGQTKEGTTTLEEETEKDTEELKADYKEGPQTSWVQKYFKNNHYRIHDCEETQGDCFFAAVVAAYLQIGKKTTITKLRAILADEMTEDVFKNYRALYLHFDDQLREIKKEMDMLRKAILENKKRIKTTQDKTAADNQLLLNQAKQMAEKYGELEKQQVFIKQSQKEYIGVLENVDTLEKMRAYIKTTAYWADAWAVSTLERVLNIKFILFSEKIWEESGNVAGVLNCGEIDRTLQERQSFSPEYYIMLSLGGEGLPQYRLVSYKHKKILTYKEIPYAVKMLILNKCLEKNAGPFYMIVDFRNLKSKYGIDEDEGRPVDYEDTDDSGILYDPDVVFSFYANSEKTAKPGMGDGEKIPVSKKGEYILLAKIADWRKKLDDSWEVPIFIDGHKWNTVEHYVAGSKYKKGNYEVYLMFSLDSGTELSKDVKLAKSFKGLKPDDAKKGARIKPIAPDVDYALGGMEKAREEALHEKFAKNPDMKMVLKLTQKALLLHKEKRGEEAKPDIQLMKIRSVLI